MYRAADFLGEPSPIADVGATGGARPWFASILLRTPSGLFELDPRAPANLRRAALPGVADALALDGRECSSTRSAAPPSRWTAAALR